MTHILFSNQIEQLGEILKHDLRSYKEDLFQKQIIVTPSEALREWIIHFLARDPEHPICAGVHVLSLHEALKELGFLYGDGEAFLFPSTLSLSFSLESLIRELHQGQKREDPAFSSLWEYLGISESSEIPRDKQKLLIALCDTLAPEMRLCKEAFAFYEKAPQGKSWQYSLWERVFPYKHSPLEKSGSHPQLYAFGFDSLAPYYISILCRLNARFYLLSPSQIFWGDLQTDREKIAQQRRLRAAHTAPLIQEEWAEYGEEQHPLLANFTKPERLLWKHLDDASCTQEEYFMPPPCDRLLGKVQSDIVEGDPHSRQEGTIDSSICIAAAPTKLREVEILHDYLLHLFSEKSRHGEDFAPQDVLVVVPDINGYTPYIRAVFSTREPEIPFSIRGVKRLAMRPFFYAIEHLLSLAESGFDKKSIAHLFQLPSFLKRWNFSEEDVRTLTEWIERSDVCFGIDSENRTELLEVPAQPESRGTWGEMWNAAIEGWVGGFQEAPIGYDHRLFIERSAIDLYARLIQILKELKKEFSSLLGKEEKPLMEWAEILKNMIRKNLDAEEEDRFFQDLNEFVRKNGSVNSLFPFESIKRLIREIVERESVSLNTHENNAVRFFSIHKGPFPSYKAICVLGMDEEQFPKADIRSSIHVLHEELGLPQPLRGADRDRSAFFKLLLGCRENFYISYCNLSQEDQKPQNPSLPLQEWMHYLKERFSLDSFQASCHGYSSLVSSPESPIPYFDSVFYRAARKTPSSVQIATKEALESWQLPNLKEEAYDFYDLASFARNPLKHLLRRSHIDLKPIHKPGEGEFALSIGQRSKVLRELLLRHREPRYAELQAALPSGMCGRALYKSLESEYGSLAEQMRELQIEKENLFSVNYVEGFSENRTIADAEWLCPPLKVRNAYLVGKVEDLSKEGVVLLEKSSKKEWLYYWPHNLIAHALVSNGVLDSPHLLFVKSAKKEWFPIPSYQEALEQFLQFYSLCMDRKIIFLPEWIVLLLSDEPDASLHEALAKDLANAQGKDSYWKWASARGLLPTSHQILSGREIVRAVFQGLVPYLSGGADGSI